MIIKTTIKNAMSNEMGCNTLSLDRPYVSFYNLLYVLDRHGLYATID